MSTPGPLLAVARLFGSAAIPYALIGGHAVNVWLEPRLTADLDVTAQATRDDLARLQGMLIAEGFQVARVHGAELPSGPDFVGFVSSDGNVRLEIQVAKTDFQRDIVQRAATTEDGVRVATPEDLIVLKLIANRPKDQVDLLGLVELDEIDWVYVERRAREWRLVEALRAVRAAGSEGEA